MEEAKRKTRLGRVVSDIMNKTVVVAVDTPKRHPLYHKTIKRIKKYYAHDEQNKAKPGDKVKIVETRPLSKKKCWRLSEVVVSSTIVE